MIKSTAVGTVALQAILCATATVAAPTPAEQVRADLRDGFPSDQTVRDWYGHKVFSDTYQITPMKAQISTSPHVAPPDTH